MRFLRTRKMGQVAVVATVIVLVFPAVGQTRPPESDGSTYTWPGATIVTVDVQPWGGGYVRSSPYLIDCPLACIRPVEPGITLQLTAYPTPGFTFERWTGACEGQPNPCALNAAGAAADVTAVFSGFYVPPPQAGPSLTLSVSGDCPGCVASALGNGFHPNSSITLHVEISSPFTGSADLPGFATTDANGTWTYAGAIGCDFGDGPYVGPFIEDVTATDSEGASASGHLTANCVAPD